MDKYLKMSDVFNVEVMVDNSTAYTLKSELDKLYRVREVNNHTLMCSGNDVADYAAHAINSHDELVAEVERLREVSDALMVALIDLVMIGDRDLRGLELIQPELEQAKAAIAKANGVKK